MSPTLVADMTDLQRVNEESRMHEEVSLGEFVESLSALLQKEEVPIPFENERPWHVLFYELKQDNSLTKKPRFFERLRFDWDGPYPKSQELSDFLQALHWNASVGALNPLYATFSLPKEIADLWFQRFEKFGVPVKQFLNETVERARGEFRDSVSKS